VGNGKAELAEGGLIMSCSHASHIRIALVSRPRGKHEVLLQALSQFLRKVLFLAESQPQEVTVFDHYAPRIGLLQVGASFLLVVLAVWAIILLTR
jgi:hypothetical protein